jgi:hypothetical protein
MALNSHSLPVAWFFCYGMCYGDAAVQAGHDLARLAQLRDGAISTADDITEITRVLDRCGLHHAGNALETAVLLEERNPAFKAARSVRHAA